MNVCVVGIGTLGSALANELLHQPKVTKVTLVEMHAESYRRAYGEYWDLLPVAHAVGKRIWIAKKPPSRGVDIMVITAGVPRKTTTQPKESLYATNLPIITQVLAAVSPSLKVYIATNPPNELAAWGQEHGYNTRPLRVCTDSLRQAVGDYRTINAHVLDNKGTSQWTAAYALAMEVMK